MPDDEDLSLERVARELQRPVRVSSSVDARIMRAIRRMPRHGMPRHGMPRHAGLGLWSRLTTPRRVTVTPLSWGLLAATVALFAVLGAGQVAEAVTRVAPMAAALFPKGSKVEQPHHVQFVLVAPDAKKVAVVGDFNGWDIRRAGYQAKHRGGGVWSVTAPVPVGHHRYSFVVDDSVWVADPMAPRAVDSDFGLTNSAIVVQNHE